MRSALIAAAFVAGAIAVPHYKRDVVTDTDIEIVYATEIVTVTAGAPSSSSSVDPVEDVASTASLSFHHHRYSHSTSISTSTIRTTSTSKASSVAPVSTIKTSTSVAAAPTSTKPATTSTKPATTSVAAAPTSTRAATTSVAAAPTSTKAATTSVSVVSKAASTSVAAASTSAAASAKPSTYAQIATYHHNLHRANHSAVDIIWDAGVASTAASIAASCVYAHNVTAGGGGYGQNIAAGVQPNNISAIITDLFYNGEVGWYTALYGISQPDMTNFEHWGHFSQIVWKDTTHVGCATQDCSASGLANVGSNVAPYFTVCNYVTPGNYANEYGANIGSPLGYATAKWNAGL